MGLLSGIQDAASNMTKGPKRKSMGQEGSQPPRRSEDGPAVGEEDETSVL